MDSKTPAQIAVERDERDLYLSDPELYGALVGAFTVTGSIEARIDEPRVYGAYIHAPALTLRDAVEALGYDVTEEIDAILTDNPEGPWTLEQLETIFAADVNGDHPHGVEFIVRKAQDEGVPDFIDDGDEDTRL